MCCNTIPSIFHFDIFVTVNDPHYTCSLDIFIFHEAKLAPLA